MTQADKTRAIRATIEAWLDGLRAKRAADVVAQTTPDIVAYTLAPPLVSASDRGPGLQAWFDTWRGGLGYEIRDLEITAGDDVGYAHFLSRLTGSKTDGTQADLWYRQTLGLRRHAGEWRIAHIHQSVPFYMDGSLRAAVDLAP